MLQCLDRPHRLAYFLGEILELPASEAAVKLGRARAEALQFATVPSSFNEARALVRQANDARRALALFRTSAPSQPAVDFARYVVSALDLSEGGH